MAASPGLEEEKGAGAPPGDAEGGVGASGGGEVPGPGCGPGGGVLFGPGAGPEGGAGALKLDPPGGGDEGWPGGPDPGGEGAPAAPGPPAGPRARLSSSAACRSTSVSRGSSPPSASRNRFVKLIGGTLSIGRAGMFPTTHTMPAESRRVDPHSRKCVGGSFGESDNPPRVRPGGGCLFSGAEPVCQI
ncbi:MAG: hypothetical protein BRC31_00505 [Actinobacteria bacterium QS_5_72_10]|nr:MAG: hypothetical protein BRC31_00505 [Actinobacteria bacterium QS_5_72_10]